MVEGDLVMGRAVRQRHFCVPRFESVIVSRLRHDRSAPAVRAFRARDTLVPRLRSDG